MTCGLYEADENRLMKEIGPMSVIHRNHRLKEIDQSMVKTLQLPQMNMTFNL